MRSGPKMIFVLSLALLAMGLAPLTRAAAVDCPTDTTDPSGGALSPQHLVATPNGDLDVLYSKPSVSDVARVRYEEVRNRSLTAMAIADTGAYQRPHRVVSDGTNIFFSLTKHDAIGRLAVEFTGGSATIFEDTVEPMCAPLGVELRNGDLWVANSTVDAVTVIDFDQPLDLYTYIPLGDDYEDPDPSCHVQELTRANTGNNKMYFTCNDFAAVGRIDPSGNVVSTPYFENALFEDSPHAIITGPDDFLYLTEHSDNSIGRVLAQANPDLVECVLPGSGKNPGDIIAVGTATDFDLWFTQTGDDRIGYIFDAHELVDDAWEDCAAGNPDNYFNFSLSMDVDPKGITYNEEDERIWFTEAETDAVGFIDPNDDFKIVECPLPTVTSGELSTLDCDFPDPDGLGLMVGGGLSLLDATDELTPALDFGAEEQCQPITHTVSGTLSGTMPDPDTDEPLDLTGKFELTSEVACEDEGKGEDAITSVEISDPLLSFTPDEMGTFNRDGSDVSTSGLHGVCKFTNLYFMCSITLTGGWDPVDDQTPDIEKADVTSATLVIAAE